MSQQCWKVEDDLCRCCHSEGEFVNLTDSFDFCGHHVTLVDLLRETFNIDIIPIGTDLQVMSYTICEDCKIKLQDASAFKMQVMHCEKRFKNMYHKGDIEDDNNTIWSEPYTNVEVNVKSDIEEENLNKVEAVYEDVEYLDDEIVVDNSKKINKEPIRFIPQTKGVQQKKKKKHSSREGRYQRYLQYTEEDLRNAMQAVKDNRMSRLEASEYYKVPRKTIAAHLQAEIENPENKPNRELMFKFLKEIKTILTFTNATPFKSRRNCYLCAYCNDFNTSDPAELRNHSRTEHINDRTKKVDIMMRPHCMNEILRVDIENLLCIVCCTVISDWNTMFQHMQMHDVQLEQAYKRVIPYILSSSHECALCGEKFVTYMLLDAHMNSHYTNYVCGDCGDVYLTSARLKKHMESHAVIPSKVMWNKESLLKKLTSFKCQYCPARFPTEGDKRKHLLVRHQDKVNLLSCEDCGKTFKWNKSYISHVRNVHGDRCQCSMCGKTFGREYELKAHERLKHS